MPFSLNAVKLKTCGLFTSSGIQQFDRPNAGVRISFKPDEIFVWAVIKVDPRPTHPAFAWFVVVRD